MRTYLYGGGDFEAPYLSSAAVLATAPSLKNHQKIGPIEWYTPFLQVLTLE